jgi:ElaB/YqjD/DUF883 family membrane-anchored ribosome-binding protein
MEHTTTSSENFVAALKLLEDAAKQKKDELKTVMSDKYTHLRSLIMEKEGSLMKSLATAKDQALDTAEHFKEVGVEKAREIARDVDKDVHQNPWPYVAGSAVFGVLLGYILGRGRS